MFYHALAGGNTPIGDLSPVLLWENSNVGASFDAQTIALDLTDYAGVVIDFNRKTTTQKLQTRFYMKRTDVTNDGGFYACANQTDNVSRKVSLSDTGVQFYACNDAGTGAASNTNMIPTKIYGIKNYIVEPAVGDLLWHNDNPTVALTAKEIAGDYSKYSKIYVEYRLSTTIDYKLTLIAEKHNTYQPGIMVTENSGSVYRRITFTDSTINITQCTKIDSSMATSTVNTSCIVTDIYGIE